MRHFSYSLSFLAGSLCFALLAPYSFGSDRFTQEETRERILTSATMPQRAVPFSPEDSLPQDLRVYILSFFTQQKDFLRIGVVSKSWRKATGKVWEKRWLKLSNNHLAEADYKSLAGGIFPRLILNHVKLDEKGMSILATGSHLQALELHGNNLQATESLIKLFSLACLSHINLYHNKISAGGAKAIAEALHENKTLTTVYLSGNQLGDEGTKTVAAMLKANSTLTTVNLAHNLIGVEGAKEIAAALKANSTLTTVNLGFNRIGDEGAKAIAMALHENNTLTTIELDSNRIYIEGAQAIATALKENSTLTTIILYKNKLGNAGAKVITAALKKNSTLTTVDLRYNEIDAEGTQEITADLKENKALTKVSLNFNSIGDEGRKALEDLKRNKPSLHLYY